MQQARGRPEILDSPIAADKLHAIFRQPQRPVQTLAGLQHEGYGMLVGASPNHATRSRFGRLAFGWRPVHHAVTRCYMLQIYHKS